MAQPLDTPVMQLVTTSIVTLLLNGDSSVHQWVVLISLVFLSRRSQDRNCALQDSMSATNHNVNFTLLSPLVQCTVDRPIMDISL